MTKPELIANIQAMDLSLTKADIDSVLKSLASVITKAMKDEEKVVLPGIGTFSVKETAARTARNPQTGAVVEIPAGKKVAFKVTPSLKDIVK